MLTDYLSRLLRLRGAVDYAITGDTSVSVDNALAYRVFKFTGTLSADATITLPNEPGGDWYICNATTGGYDIDVVCVGGAIAVPNGEVRAIVADDDGTLTTATAEAVPFDGEVAFGRLWTAADFFYFRTAASDAETGTLEATLGNGKLDLGTNAIHATTAKLTSLSTGIAHVDADGDVTSSTVVNADVSAAAAIAGTKIAPNFGAQNITTTGDVQADEVSANTLVADSVTVSDVFTAAVEASTGLRSGGYLQLDAVSTATFPMPGSDASVSKLTKVTRTTTGVALTYAIPNLKTVKIVANVMARKTGDGYSADFEYVVRRDTTVTELKSVKSNESSAAGPVATFSISGTDVIITWTVVDASSWNIMTDSTVWELA